MWRPKKAINYIENQFNKIGLNITVEPFEFESFEISKTTFKISGEDYKPTQLGFNPFSGVKSYKGTAVLLNPTSTPNEIREKKVGKGLLRVCGDVGKRKGRTNAFTDSSGQKRRSYDLVYSLNAPT